MPVESHFFDDLGADSLVMAHFCARVRKRADLPSVSMKDIYAHPTIRSLAESFGIAEAETGLDAPTLIQPRDPVAGRTRGGGQHGAVRPVRGAAAAVLPRLCLGRRARRRAGLRWISTGTGLADIYLRAVVFGGPASSSCAPCRSWPSGCSSAGGSPRQIRIWSLGYVRFWIVKTLVRSNPLALLTVGSPLYVLYLRALGAKIGPGTVIFSRHVPVCTDLLTIGPDTVIRKDAIFACYRAQAGWIQTGPVTLGRKAFVGEKSRARHQHLDG